jgi:hypothetical protein
MASMNTTLPNKQINNQIETFIEFLLDTETTSEISFIQAISEKDDLYHERYQTSFEKIVNQKLQQWRDFYQKEQGDIADRISMNARSDVLDNKSESESEQESSSDDGEGQKPQTRLSRKNQVNLYFIYCDISKLIYLYRYPNRLNSLMSISIPLVNANDFCNFYIIVKNGIVI